MASLFPDSFTVLTPPSFPGKRPVLINIHGGPEGQSRPCFQGRNNYFLNEMGIAIFLPERARFNRLRQNFSYARQRFQT